MTQYGLGVGMCGRRGVIVYNSGMTQRTIEQAMATLGTLVDAAMDGEDVVLVRNGGGAVRLVPLDQPQKSPRFGSAKGLITMSDDFDAPLDDFREYTESHECRAS